MLQRVARTGTYPGVSLNIQILQTPGWIRSRDRVHLTIQEHGGLGGLGQIGQEGRTMDTRKVKPWDRWDSGHGTPYNVGPIESVDLLKECGSILWTIPANRLANGRTTPPVRYISPTLGELTAEHDGCMGRITPAQYHKPIPNNDRRYNHSTGIYCKDSPIITTIRRGTENTREYRFRNHSEWLNWQAVRAVLPPLPASVAWFTAQHGYNRLRARARTIADSATRRRFGRLFDESLFADMLSAIADELLSAMSGTEWAAIIESGGSGQAYLIGVAKHALHAHNRKRAREVHPDLREVFRFNRRRDVPGEFAALAVTLAESVRNMNPSALWNLLQMNASDWVKALSSVPVGEWKRIAQLTDQSAMLVAVAELYRGEYRRKGTTVYDSQESSDRSIERTLLARDIVNRASALDLSILSMLGQGKSIRTIAEHLGVSKFEVERTIIRIRNTMRKG